MTASFYTTPGVPSMRQIFEELDQSSSGKIYMHRLISDFLTWNSSPIKIEDDSSVRLTFAGEGEGLRATFVASRTDFGDLRYARDSRLTIDIYETKKVWTRLVCTRTRFGKGPDGELPYAGKALVQMFARQGKDICYPVFGHPHPYEYKWTVPLQDPHSASDNLGGSIFLSLVALEFAVNWKTNTIHQPAHHSGITISRILRTLGL